MTQNEASALSYYEATLAAKIAVLPIGVPENARRERAYTSDLQQPMTEHFLHGLAALTAFSHFKTPKRSGIYTLGTRSRDRFDAELPTILGDISIDGGSGQLAHPVCKILC